MKKITLILLAFVSLMGCSKGGNDTPTLPAEPNTAVIDGITYPVHGYTTYNTTGNDFCIALFLNQYDSRDYITIAGNTAQHLKATNLSEKEAKRTDKAFYWTVTTYLYEGKTIFSGSGNPESSRVTFSTGNLEVAGSFPDKFTFKLQGKVTDAVWGDGQEHTISLQYTAIPSQLKSELPKPGFITEIKNITVLGEPKAIVSWTASADNKIPANKLKYQLVYQEKGNVENTFPIPFQPEENKFSATIPIIKPKTTYRVWVEVWNENRMLRTPFEEFTTD